MSAVKKRSTRSTQLYQDFSSSEEDDEVFMQRMTDRYAGSQDSMDEEDDDEENSSLENDDEDSNGEREKKRAEQRAKRQKLRDEERKKWLVERSDQAQKKLRQHYPLIVDGIAGRCKPLFYLTEAGQPTLKTCPLFLMNKELLVEFLNQKDENGEFELSFAGLSRIAASSQAWWFLFYDMHFSFWYNVIQSRVVLDMNIPPRPMLLKHKDLVNAFVGGVLKDRRDIKVYTNAYVAYTNLFSAGGCKACGAYIVISQKLHRSLDVIPIATFRVETPEEIANFQPLSVRDLNLQTDKFFDELPPGWIEREGQPTWLTILLTIRNACTARYRCVNCSSLLDEEVCGLPAQLIFSACGERKKAAVNPGERKNIRSHSWKRLETDLIGPSGVIVGSFNYCTICGVCSYNMEETQFEMFPCGQPKCFKKKKCTCTPCALCNRMEDKCRCLICDVCSGCQEYRCAKECTKKCSC